MSFGLFCTEVDFDEFVVYSGPSETDGILDAFSGCPGSLPNDLIITLDSVQVLFYSDISTVHAGVNISFTSGSVLIVWCDLSVITYIIHGLACMLTLCVSNITPCNQCVLGEINPELSQTERTCVVCLSAICNLSCHMR